MIWHKWHLQLKVEGYLTSQSLFVPFFFHIFFVVLFFPFFLYSFLKLTLFLTTCLSYATSSEPLDRQLGGPLLLFPIISTYAHRR